MKAKIRTLVEAEEKVNYETRMAEKWKQDLEHMMSAIHNGGGDITKPYLTEAPYLVLVFSQPYGLDRETGEKIDHYYVAQSVGIAVGMFTAALHEASLCSLVSTPMGSESEVKQMLHRPVNEKLFCLMPVGHPASDATVPKVNCHEHEHEPHVTCSGAQFTSLVPWLCSLPCLTRQLARIQRDPLRKPMEELMVVV